MRVASSAAIASASLLVLAPSSFEAGSRPAALVFSKVPGRAVAGQAVTVSISRAVPGSRCSLKVKYAKAPTPLVQPAIAGGGMASWSWTIPVSTQANWAQLTATCGSKSVSKRLLVVGALSPAKLSVVKDGFSIRKAAYGNGTDVSYGVIIKNTSPNADAQSVNVIVNFVLANDHLLGSKSDSIASIPAGSSYNLGGSMSFPGGAPIARLEIVMQVGTTAPHAGHPLGLANVVIEPNLPEDGWVSDVAGEVINNDPNKVLQSVSFSAVILDGAGNVLGGGTGLNYGALPPGTRVVFKLTTGGFRDVSMTQASSVLVSATPTWQ